MGNSLTSRNNKRSGADVIDFIEDSQPKNAKNGKNNERKYCLKGEIYCDFGKISKYFMGSELCSDFTEL